MVATIGCLPKRVSGEEEQVRIERRKDNRLGPQHPEVFCLHRHWKYILRLTGAAIESRQLAADDNVWIQRVGDNVTIFLGRDRLPIAECDFAFTAAAFDSHRTALLLSAVKPVRKRVVSANVIQLRSGLVIPRAPALASIHSDDRALVRTEKNNVGTPRIDPNILIVVPAGSASPAFPRCAPVRRFPTHHARPLTDRRTLGIT